MAYIPKEWVCGDAVTADKLNALERGVADMTDGYTPTVWQCGDIITAEKMNKLEQGVAQGGGSKAEVPLKDINFYDYDGTVVASYTASEWANQTALPSNPSHTGLTAQGWNYTKAQIDAEVTAQGKCNVGQMYITESGDTEIDIELCGERLSPKLGICLDGTVEIDWGDGSAKDTITGTSLTTIVNTSHTYAKGSYTIKIHVVDGSFAILGISTSSTGSRLLWNGSTGSANSAYQNAIQAVRLGSGITSIGSYAFGYCYSLSSITIPNSIVSIDSSAFNSCYSLKSITIPSGVTIIASYAFGFCYSLKSVAMPSSVTTIELHAFENCNVLDDVVIPSAVTLIGSNAFNYCYSLSDITIPDGVTSISGSAFKSCYSLSSVKMSNNATSIGSSAFTSCNALVSITIPSSVTTIASNAFGSCSSLAKVVFESTTPPTLSRADAFATTPSDRVVYVPQGTLATYQGATNYTNIKSQMVEAA